MTICFYPWLNVGLVIYESLLLLAPGDTDTSISIIVVAHILAPLQLCWSLWHNRHTWCWEHSQCLFITYQDIKRQKPRRRFRFMGIIYLAIWGGDTAWPSAYHHLTNSFIFICPCRIIFWFGTRYLSKITTSCNAVYSISISAPVFSILLRLPTYHTTSPIGFQSWVVRLSELLRVGWV